jgi:hypothetical protein
MGKGFSKESRKLSLSGKATRLLEDAASVDLLLDPTFLVEKVEVKSGPLTELPLALTSSLRLNIALQNALTYLDLSKNNLVSLPDSLFSLGSPRCTPG